MGDLSEKTENGQPGKILNQPVDPNVMPKFSGIVSMLRLPVQTLDTTGMYIILWHGWGGKV
jgi:hypothetical protein